MRRRQFLALVSGVVAWPRNAHSQTLTKVNRFGLLDPARPLSANRPDATTLLTALAARGYTLGQNLAYDARAAGGDNSKLPDVWEDFKASGVDVIVTIGLPGNTGGQGRRHSDCIAHSSRSSGRPDDRARGDDHR
jgi:putative tryptophan/tyrosine transport system substrate-binding protein